MTDFGAWSCVRERHLESRSRGGKRIWRCAGKGGFWCAAATVFWSQPCRILAHACDPILAGFAVHDFRARSRWISGRSHDRFVRMVVRVRAASGAEHQGRGAHLEVWREGWILVHGGDGFWCAAVQDFGAPLCRGRLRARFGVFGGSQMRGCDGFPCALALDFGAESRRILGHGCARRGGPARRAADRGSAGHVVQRRVDFGARRRQFSAQGRDGFCCRVALEILRSERRAGLRCAAATDFRARSRSISA